MSCILVELIVLALTFGPPDRQVGAKVEPRAPARESSANVREVADPTPPVALQQGQIRGLVTAGKEIHAFRGIPYAAPPVGHLRWKPPQPPAAWSGIRDCFEFGPACPQKSGGISAAIPWLAIRSFSEDCLSLNVFCPPPRANAKRPVMVWIHGGGYTEGASSQQVYDGASLARHGVVVVTINYRLGPFGFAAHPALSAESPEGVSGNYGLLDQIEALRWVQKNIAPFGGDPERVTIFGESAGGGSVLCLLVSPKAKGIFHRAIAQSAPEMNLAHLRQTVRGRAAAEAEGTRLFAQCGASLSANADALRQIPASKLVEVFPKLEVIGREPNMKELFLPTGPVVDGAVIPEDPNDAIHGGRFARVPLLIGTTRDEATLFLLFAKVPRGKEQYQSLLRREFGAIAERLLAFYPPSAEAKVLRGVAVELMTDLIYGSQARYTAMHFAGAGLPAYKYVFSRESRLVLPTVAGAHHGCEIPYLFGLDVRGLLDWDRQLSDQMQRYWCQFAAAGDPNGSGLPDWPRFDTEREATLELGDRILVLDRYRKARLELIDEYLRRPAPSTNTQARREPSQGRAISSPSQTREPSP